MSFDLDFGFVSQAGRKGSNEDFAGLLQGQGADRSRGVVAAIADGVSQGGLGRDAAQTSVNTLLHDYFGTPDTWETTVALDRVIAAQNSWLAAMNRRQAPRLGLSTLTALVLCGQSYTVAHVGDTRAYLVRDGERLQLTTDHAVGHRDLSHQLTRAMGLDDRILVDYSQGDLHSGDLFVLVSDGVHRVLPSREWRELLARGLGAQALSEALVESALRHGSQDNVSALVVRVLGAQEALLQDDARRAAAQGVLPLLKVGDGVDGLVVTALVADSGVFRLYQVRDPVSQRLYALKTLHPQRAHDHEERATLAHEAWVARRMQGGRAAEHLARLVDWPPAGTHAMGPRSDCFYLLYEWHRGETLGQRLARQQAFGAGQAVELALQAARTLGLLHRQGVVHRDVKPDNLHLDEDGVLRLLDLGVALSGREPAATRQLHAGTPSYMNPEQWPGYERGGAAGESGRLPDAQSDLFALGVTLYQLLSRGRLPYGEVLPYQLGRYYRDPLPPSRHNPEVPVWLDQLALKAVARQAPARFETAEELVLALERGAMRPMGPGPGGASPLLSRDPVLFWRLLAAFSLLVNLLLLYWLLFLPR